MSMPLIGRRQFLTLSFAALFASSVRASGASQVVRGGYAADIGILYDMMSLHLRGHIEEIVDRTSGRYRIKADGTGPGIANRIESTGIMRDGRWAPVHSQSWFDVRGRQSRTEIAYDWAKRQIQYHARGETFFLRRLRSVDDLVAIPDRGHVDDVMSATLNYADRRWPVQADGAHKTFVVRRRRADHEGPDDVASSYRAEIVPFELNMEVDASGKPTALFDLSRFSSWAKASEPARIVFSAERRPEVIKTSMILGSSVTIRFTGA